MTMQLIDSSVLPLAVRTRRSRFFRARSHRLHLFLTPENLVGVARKTKTRMHT